MSLDLSSSSSSLSSQSSEHSSISCFSQLLVPSPKENIWIWPCSLFRTGQFCCIDGRKEYVLSNSSKYTSIIESSYQFLNPYTYYSFSLPSFLYNNSTCQSDKEKKGHQQEQEKQKETKHILPFTCLFHFVWYALAVLNEDVESIRELESAHWNKDNYTQLIEKFDTKSWTLTFAAWEWYHLWFQLYLFLLCDNSSFHEQLKLSGWFEIAVLSDDPRWSYSIPDKLLSTPSFLPSPFDFIGSNRLGVVIMNVRAYLYSNNRLIKDEYPILVSKLSTIYSRLQKQATK